MSQSEAWLDHLVSIGLGLFVVVMILMLTDIPWWIVGGLAVLWLLWELGRWWRHSRTGRG